MRLLQVRINRNIIMKLTFNIEYKTRWGEEIRVLGNIPQLGNEREPDAFRLSTSDGIRWQGSVETDKEAIRELKYSYLLVSDGKTLRKEWKNPPHTVPDAGDSSVVRLEDRWNDISEKQHFYSSAFTEALLAREKRDGQKAEKGKNLIIRVLAPEIDSRYAVAISGNQKVLGSWNGEKALLMSDTGFPEWNIRLKAEDIVFPLEYKFLLCNKETGETVQWEEGINRRLDDPGLKKGETAAISCSSPDFSLPQWKGAGVAIPVFSLKSEESFGVGDFGDLKKMIDWAVQTGQKVVQILPINDTTLTHKWTDSYPYNSISIYAFHPMYICLKALGTLKDRKAAEKFSKIQKELNSLPVMDYEAVNNAKREYLLAFYRQEGEKVLKSKGYAEFLNENGEWLIPYAAFSYLRDLYHTPNFREWPAYSTYKKEEIEKLTRSSESGSAIKFYCYIQYQLHLQLLEASRYARSRGVVLKGDIPIGISRDSVEAWKEPHYFNLNGQAGAPPDDFSANGQNWGFPTYNWEVMKQDGYAWWMKRFRKMSEYFDAYRIDHILGFFRIWEIPTDSVHGLLGQFVPALPMSREEIEGYGLRFDERFFLTPYIHEDFLERVFGENTQFVKDNFIEPAGEGGTYRMRAPFDTQRKVERHFEGKDDERSISVREGLYTLISDVLFVRDRNNPQMYHPRISAQLDFIYQALAEHEKRAFNALYDDYFYHRHNQYWGEQAMEKLPQLVQSTRMLVCGEDLGMIPECVAGVMNELKILSLEIQRMPKNPAQTFGNPKEYPCRSVCTFSTHDMSTLRGWWEENRELTQRFYNEQLGHAGEAPRSADAGICEEIVRQQLEGNSLLTILSLQDWMSMDESLRMCDPDGERINVPSNPRHYWRYRMNLTIEELLAARSLNDKIKSLLIHTGRTGRTSADNGE